MPIYKTNKKKNGLQQYRVEVSYKDSEGKYKKHIRTAYGIQEAKEIEVQLQSQNNKVNSFYTILDLYNDYIANKEVRTTSLNKTKSVLNNHVLPYEKNTRLQALSKEHFLKWKQIINKKPLSIRTKRNVFKEYVAMLNWAVHTDKLEKNLLSELGNFVDVYFEDTPNEIRYYTANQYKLYEKAMLETNETLSDYCYYVFFSIAFYTGMRKGEINALKWSDIENNIIHIRRSISQKVKSVGIVETPPKTKSSYRDIQMPTPLINILKEHKEKQCKMEGFSEDWRVCGGIKCLSDTSIENHNQKYSKLANLPHITIHEFRHTHASLLCNEGINIQEIARRLGHSNVQITWQTYSHLYPREEERAVAILNKI